MQLLFHLHLQLLPGFPPLGGQLNGMHFSIVSQDAIQGLQGQIAAFSSVLDPSKHTNAVDVMLKGHQPMFLANLG